MDNSAISGAPSGPVGVLLSDVVNEHIGLQLDHIAHDAGVSLRRYTSAQARADLAAIHLAFFSRDLYEGSSLRKPGPRSNAFFQVADATPHLRWLHVCSSGLDLPQYTKSLERGVRVTGSTGVTAVPLAQTVLAAILAQSRGFDHWISVQSRKQWVPLTGQDRPKEIEGQHVVIVGAGAIGREIGRLLKTVGFRVTGVRRAAVATLPFDDIIAISELDRILPYCDWLVLAAPLTPQTHGLIDQRRLALLPRNARIVNIARGELIDEAALTRALGNGQLRGAYLDTFIEEPLPKHSLLWSLPNVWISPHSGAASQGHEKRVIEGFITHFRSWLAGSGRANRSA